MPKLWWDMTLKAESLAIVVFFVVQMRLLVLWKTEQPQWGCFSGRLSLRPEVGVVLGGGMTPFVGGASHWGWGKSL